MRSKVKHNLNHKDYELFSNICTHYQSDNESRFFGYLFEMEQWDCSLAGELLLSEDDNEEGLYIMRLNFDEYVVGRDGQTYDDYHAMNLSDALALDLRDCSFLSESISLGKWLKKRDYVGIRYDRNNDY